MNRVTQPPTSAGIRIFSPEISKFCYIDDVTNKILSRDSNYILDMFM